MIHPDYEANIGKQVSISGVAKNARIGAIVVPDDGIPIYIDGVEKWESDIWKKPIIVKGLLSRKSLAPDPEVNTDGEVSHGISGDNYVLENPHWTIDK